MEQLVESPEPPYPSKTKLPNPFFLHVSYKSYIVGGKNFDYSFPNNESRRAASSSCNHHGTKSVTLTIIAKKNIYDATRL